MLPDHGGTMPGPEYNGRTGNSLRRHPVNIIRTVKYDKNGFKWFLNTSTNFNILPKGFKLKLNTLEY